MSDPYKELSKDQLLAECIRLRDKIRMMEDIPMEKTPRVFRRWHAALVFAFISFGFVMACAWFSQEAAISTIRNDMFHAIPAIFFGLVAFVFGWWSVALIADDKLTNKFLV